jgi:RNA polymerase sigma-70 factor (ECF subfamily)
LQTHDDEPNLISRSCEGDLDAFNVLVERYQRPLYNLCLRMLGAPEPAEDATQDAFIHAFRSIKTFHGGSFRAWLFRIGANACYDEMRRRRARPALSLDEPRGGEGQPIDVRDPAPRLDELVERLELAELLQDALSRLPSGQRLAIVLADVHGFDYSEIAVAMECSLGTVKSRISRGRSQLRLILRAHGELLPARLRQVSEGQNDVVV